MLLQGVYTKSLALPCCAMQCYDLLKSQRRGNAAIWAHAHRDLPFHLKHRAIVQQILTRLLGRCQNPCNRTPCRCTMTKQATGATVVNYHGYKRPMPRGVLAFPRLQAKAKQAKRNNKLKRSQQNTRPQDTTQQSLSLVNLPNCPNHHRGS